MTNDLTYLITDKYNGDASKITQEDKDRLASGEPLAYIIGWVPFLGLKIFLESKPLIPRTETEYWCEKALKEISQTTTRTVRVLDMCAGSGAIGLAVLSHCPQAVVTFIEIDARHCDQIKANALANGIDSGRFEIVQSDVFTNAPDHCYDYILSNPPYIPQDRVLDESVKNFEPSLALFSGADGLAIIRRIFYSIKKYLCNGGQVWIECDSAHAQEVEAMARAQSARATLFPDQYGKARYCVAYY
jgi:release factor glutamine methyltransferase